MIAFLLAICAVGRLIGEVHLLDALRVPGGQPDEYQDADDRDGKLQPPSNR